VSHFLPPQSALPHTAVVIVLDWTRPWAFLDELHTWLTWIEHWVQGDGSRELQVIREEHRERCESVSSFFFASGTDRSHTQGRHTSSTTLNHPPNHSLQRPARYKLPSFR